MKNKFLIIILLLLLVGCNDNTTSYNVVNDTQGNVQNKDTNIVSDKQEEQKDLSQLEDIVSQLEDAQGAVINFKLSTDDLFELYSKYMTDGMLKERENRFVYGWDLPGSVVSVAETNTSNMPRYVTYDMSKGLSLEEIIETYKNEVSEFVEAYYGDVLYDPVEISNVYDDGYFKYVFTRQKIKLDKIFGEAVEEVTNYKKYTFIEKDETYIITELEKFYYFELDDGFTDEALSNMKTFSEKEKNKYTFFKEESIWD